MVEDDAAAKRAAEIYPTGKEIRGGFGCWTCWTDISRADDGRVGAEAGCLNGDGRTVFCSYLGR